MKATDIRAILFRKAWQMSQTHFYFAAFFTTTFVHIFYYSTLLLNLNFFHFTADSHLIIKKTYFKMPSDLFLLFFVKN